AALGLQRGRAPDLCYQIDVGNEAEMNLKIYEAPDADPAAEFLDGLVESAAKAQNPVEDTLPKPPRKKHPRCACGCGKAARWPQGDDPIFHNRLCGYEMALEIVRGKRAAAQ